MSWFGHDHVTSKLVVAGSNPAGVANCSFLVMPVAGMRTAKPVLLQPFKVATLAFRLGSAYAGVRAMHDAGYGVDWFRNSQFVMRQREVG